MTVHSRPVNPYYNRQVIKLKGFIWEFLDIYLNSLRIKEQ